MTNKLSFVALVLLAATTLGSCSLLHSAGDDVSSSNPAISQQAQKVVDLQAQVQEQERVADAEKAKLDGLKQQLEGAKQNLKGVKTQAKAS